MEHSSKERKSIILLALLVLLGAVLAYSYMRNKGSEVANVQPEEVPKVKIVRADVGVTTLPPGFPTEIPIGDVITESYKEIDPIHDRVLYRVSFVSKKNVSMIQSVYADFFSRAGYTLASSTDVYIEGKKNGATLSASVAPSADKEFRVTVNLVVH